MACPVDRMAAFCMVMDRPKTLIPLMSLLVLFGPACAQREGGVRSGTTGPEKQNEVVLYLEGAERQAETEEQQRELLRALEDLRTLSAATLKGKRYADYQNVPGKWTLAELLQKYFVPRQLHRIHEESLYRDAQSPGAREVIDQQIRALREGRQAYPPP